MSTQKQNVASTVKQGSRVPVVDPTCLNTDPDRLQSAVRWVNARRQSGGLVSLRSEEKRGQTQWLLTVQPDGGQSRYVYSLNGVLQANYGVDISEVLFRLMSMAIREAKATKSRTKVGRIAV